MIRRLDLDASPESVLSHFAQEPGLVFLDSARPGTDFFSVLSCRPQRIIRDDLPDLFVAPRSAVRSHSDDADEGFARPPFVSGWIGFAAYESAPLWNRDLITRPAAQGLPLAWWGRYDASLAYRHADGVWFLTHAETAEGIDHARLLVEPILTTGDRRSPGFEAGHPCARICRERYSDSIRSCLDWIGRGHIYQANFTYRVSTEFSGDPVAFYQRLRVENPAGFGALLSPSPDLSILSSSPEQFLHVEGDRIETRPIKGTRPRDPADPGRDRELARELLASDKDRAELAMIVDLERNDLGRICRFGSVATSPFPELESHATVHHLAATVRGTLAEAIPFRSVMAATFPGGSVTGAPRIRAMEIIAELEDHPRFVYTGAIGYLDDSGDLDLSLAIRTLWAHAGSLHLGVGGGIVADSLPDAEWEETLHKSRGMLRALRDDRDFETPSETPLENVVLS